MKKFLLYTAFLILNAPLLLSCDNENEIHIPDNTFTFNGNEYYFEGGDMIYYGNYYSDSSESVELYLGDNGPMRIFFDILVPNGKDRIVTGKYTYLFESSYPAMSIREGWIYDGAFRYHITGGTVIVDVSGADYTVTFNCTLETEPEMRLIGKYVGPLTWYDESDSYIHTGAGTGEYTFEGENFDFAYGFVGYLGNYYSDSSEFVELLLGSAGPARVCFETMIPNGNNSLLAGTYTYVSDNSYAPMTFGVGWASNGTTVYDMTDGKLNVEISADTYTITFDCLLDSGGRLTGKYTGKLGWNDVSGIARMKMTPYGVSEKKWNTRR